MTRKRCLLEQKINNELNSDFSTYLDFCLSEKILSEREFYIINKRIEGETLDKIGKHFNLTRQRIRQIESSSIFRLIQPKVYAKFKIYISN
jgi:DNA-directed RNA polymerase, sigma subunit (sigma70/sigma32)